MHRWLRPRNCSSRDSHTIGASPESYGTRFAEKQNESTGGGLVPPLCCSPTAIGAAFTLSMFTAAPSARIPYDGRLLETVSIDTTFDPSGVRLVFV